MRHEIIDAPDFGLLKVTFDQPGEKIVAEAGAMVAMSGELDIQTNMQGGLLAGMKRAVLGGESLFQNTYTAKAPGQSIFLAPAPEGDLRALDLAPGQNFFLQSGAYVAHVGDQLKLDSSFQGLKGFFGGAGGLFMLRITGPGTVFYSTYGAIYTMNVGPEGYTVDNSHIVGWTDGLQYSVRTFGGFKGLFFSGEGLVTDFFGQGTVFIQTRNPTSLAAFLRPFRPKKQSN